MFPTGCAAFTAIALLVTDVTRLLLGADTDSAVSAARSERARAPPGRARDRIAARLKRALLRVERAMS